MLDLRLAPEVARVGIQINNTVGELLEGVRTSTHRSGGYGTNLGKVTLFKTELVVVIIIQGCIAVVAQRSDCKRKLVDHVCGYFGSYNSHAVIAGLLNTFDMICRIAGFYTNSGVIVNIFRNQVRQSRACCLSFHGREVPFILIADGHKEILCSSAVSQLEAPTSCCRGNVGSAVLCHVINDFLCKCSTTVIYCSPESGLLIFCPQREVCVVFACCCDQGSQGCHTFPVLLQTKDRLAVESCRAVVGRIAIYIHAENYIINGDRCSVREGQIITNGNVIINGTVVVLSHLQIRCGIIGIVCSIVRTSLTFDTFLNNSALSVRA